MSDKLMNKIVCMCLSFPYNFFYLILMPIPRSLRTSLCSVPRDIVLHIQIEPIKIIQHENECWTMRENSGNYWTRDSGSCHSLVSVSCDVLIFQCNLFNQ